MKRFYEALKSNNIACGYLYFYVHFVIEVVCFFYLSRVTNNSNFVWFIPFIYDGLAFVPQGLVGYINDLYPKINSGIIGVSLTILAYIVYVCFNSNIYTSLIILCLGNAFIHVSGAENTLRNSEGKLAHSAIFVGGGSFGVVIGRILARTALSPILMIPFVITMIPFILLADTYSNHKIENTKFDYTNPKINPIIIVLLATFVVVVRGYMGYGIPTSWNKTTLQTVMLFFTMGIGKCLGGILSDAYGIRKVGIISTLLAIPFLSFGDDLMIVSLIGVMFFSMTMAITLAIIVSIYKDRPGLAFGFTTIGLFLGTIPIFFMSITSKLANVLMIVVLSILCSIILGNLLRKEGKA